MKVGVIGTSHTACIKAGWERASTDLGHSIEVEFFAVGGNHFSSFEQEEDGILRAIRGTKADRDMARRQAVAINGKEEINLNNFDVVCVVGPQTGIEAVSRLTAQVTVGSKPDDALNSMTLISSSTFEGIQADLLNDALQKWPLRGCDGQQQFSLPSPFPFEKFLDPNVGGVLGERVRKSLSTNPNYVPTVLRYIENLHNAFSARLDVKFLGQPKQTISELKIISVNAYCRGAMRLGGDAQPIEDFTHANADYGLLFWHEFARIVGGPADA